MNTLHVIGLLLFALAGAATWLCRRTTSVRGGLLVWITYVLSLCSGVALLAP